MALFASGLSTLVQVRTVGAVALQVARRPWLRISAVAVALTSGYAVCFAVGELSPPPPGVAEWLAVPVPFQYGLAFR